MITASNLIKNIQNYLHNENPIIKICEVGLVIVFAITLANLVTDFIQKPNSYKPFASGSNISAGINSSNVQDLAGLNRQGSDGSPSMQLKQLFGVPTTLQNDAQVENREQLQETQLNLKLKGILMNDQTGRRLALIASPSNSEEIYHIGDEIEGAEIVRIETRRVVIRRNGINEALYLEIPKLESINSDQSSIKSASFGKNGIRNIGENKRTVSQQILRQQLNNLPRLLQQAKAVPHTENGQSMGFKVTEIQTGSVFEDLGLQQEDIIRSVNGTPIKSAEDALNAYRKFRTEKSFQLDLVRSGRAMTLNLTVQ